MQMFRVTLCRRLARTEDWLCNSCFCLLVEISYPNLLCLLVTCLLLVGVPVSRCKLVLKTIREGVGIWKLGEGK